MATALLASAALGAAACWSSPVRQSKCHRGSSNQRVVVVVSVVRCSKSGEPLRRPSLNAPPASPSTLPPPPLPSPPQAPPAAEHSAAAPLPPAMASSSSKASGVTIEYQRQRAKEMQEYFLDKKFEDETSQSRIFGWTRKNEIANGRWVMFGLAVGLLTEYATGSDFVEQLKIIVSNLGIADVD